jgi:N-methylhydantoinase A
VRVAQQFDIPTVIIPPSPGVRSAFGLLVCDLSFDYIRTQLMNVSDADPVAVQGMFEEMEFEGRKALLAAGLDESQIQLQRDVGVRLVHQRHEIAVRVPGGISGERTIEEADARFRSAYFSLFGIHPSDHCQLVNFQVRALGSPEKPVIREHAPRAGNVQDAYKGSRRAYFEEAGGFVDTPIYDRLQLRAGDIFSGPALVEEIDATTVCPQGFTVAVGVDTTGDGARCFYDGHVIPSFP